MKNVANHWNYHSQVELVYGRCYLTTLLIGSRREIINQQVSIRLSTKSLNSTSYYSINWRNCFEANDKKLVGALLLDLSKAFDTISRSVLLNKLKAYGISNEELEWFASYLFYRSLVVDINNKRPNDFYIYSGVPPGSILGPLLFLIFLMTFLMLSKSRKC